MEPIRATPERSEQIDDALTTVIRKARLHIKISSPFVVRLAEEAELALDEIGLPETLRSGAVLKYGHVGPDDKRGVEVILSRRSSYWYATSVKAFSPWPKKTGEEVLEFKAIFLSPKQYKKACPRHCSRIKIFLGHATKDEIINIKVHRDATTNAVFYLVFFYSISYSYPLFAIVPSVEGATLVFRTDILSSKPLDASKYDGWLRVQISKWEAKRK